MFVLFEEKDRIYSLFGTREDIQNGGAYTQGKKTQLKEKQGEFWGEAPKKIDEGKEEKTVLLGFLYNCCETRPFKMKVTHSFDVHSDGIFTHSRENKIYG